MGATQQAFHERAAPPRPATSLGKQVFVRAVVEVSNFLRENCSYCGMPAINRDLARYQPALAWSPDGSERHRRH